MKVRKLRGWEARHVRNSGVLDLIRPYSGPCLFCGGPDQRHRLADALVESVRAGDSPTFVAEVYGVPERTIHRLVAEWDPS